MIQVAQFICPAGFYGAERWILALAKNLDKAVCPPKLVVTMEPGMGELEVVKHFRDLGGEVVEIATRGRFDFTAVSALKDYVREHGIQILHTHGYKSDIIGLLAARMAGIKALSTPHGFENAQDLKLRSYIWLGNQFLKRFDHVAPLSTQLLADLDQIGVNRKKVTYIQNGVDLDEVEAQFSDPDNPLVHEKKMKRVGFIGQLISRKNITHLLDVFAEVTDKFPQAELVLIGDGDERQQLELQAAQKLAGKQVSFLGFRDDRLAWLQSFDAFVMTSSLEGIPRCLMEAMAMGVPICAYDISGVDQLIEHGVNGQLAPFGDKAQLAAHLHQILSDDAFASDLAQRARDYVYERFSGQRMAGEYVELYQTMLGQGAADGI